MIPVSECNRRSRKDVPCPARNGATPCLTLAGAAGLAVVATMTAPYEFGLEDRTFYYPGRMEGKSRERGRFVNPNHCRDRVYKCAEHLCGRVKSVSYFGHTTRAISEMRHRGGCTSISLQELVPRTFSGSEENKTSGRIRSRQFLAGGRESVPRQPHENSPVSARRAPQQLHTRIVPSASPQARLSTPGARGHCWRHQLY